MNDKEIPVVFSVQLSAESKKDIALIPIPVVRSPNLRHVLKEDGWRPCRHALDVLRVLLTDPEFQKMADVNETMRIEYNSDRPNQDLFFVFVHQVAEEPSYVFLDVETYIRGSHYRSVGMLVEKHHEE